MPPFTDTVGELVAAAPTVQVLHKSGAVVDISADNIVSVRVLPPVPVLNRDIRSMQRAAALAWPGLEHQWLDGWFVRASDGHTRRANSAVPLDHSASSRALGELDAWYTERGLPTLLCLPDRLIHPPDDLATSDETVVMVRDLDNAGTDTLPAEPSADWLALHGDNHPLVVPVLTAVVDGTLGFAAVASEGSTAAIARGAVTENWLGISAVRVAENQRRRGLAAQVCDILLGWGAALGARRAYVQVRADNAAALALYPTLGFTEQHRYRYAQIRAAGHEK
ncbi:putative acetyltransferase [Mycobacteroides abscessus 6G-0728-R]|uniref:Acetyltransferase family protein n=1 Tax=Mycobacteroides abscessus 1948 TaxID=1299323 RepID=A0A829QKH5_9MYCO|nr:putative acetyltransferase [Mycobacteroides abscessus 6G-0125-S]EIU39599.1 putative acetyltransferase [Mycobacteroides abscessus 6G-0125-R]EIU51857.1 putative acetyltransferase [Mycobacteroides abscessus 6G-1108]EIU53860.1 putative acetyltransferase [Mycobacteroides abscessus 6G-0728-S]EIU89423.1 putative acetyltransferase [Mycobacteroides abscessus 6G-0212]EIU95514.1 putative acetyltransferase [Mycobacteroides abscessus 6G-0728-R]EIV20330.1 putative acetyltransferase [Mycobacteroides absc